MRGPSPEDRIRAALPDGVRFIHVIEAITRTSFDLTDAAMILETCSRDHPSAYPFWREVEAAQERDAIQSVDIEEEFEAEGGRHEQD